MDALAEIRKIYFSTTRSTIQKDFDRAIDLLKTLPSEEERDKAAVFMEGLAEMRKEWGLATKKTVLTTARARTSGPARGRTRRRG